MLRALPLAQRRRDRVGDLRLRAAHEAAHNVEEAAAEDTVAAAAGGGAERTRGKDDRRRRVRRGGASVAAVAAGGGGGGRRGERETVVSEEGQLAHRLEGIVLLHCVDEFEGGLLRGARRGDAGR